MESTYSQPLIEMGVSLTELAIKGTATAITNKIKTVKDEKNAEMKFDRAQVAKTRLAVVF